MSPWFSYDCLLLRFTMQVRDSSNDRSIVETILLLLQVLDLNGIVLHCLKTIVIGWSCLWFSVIIC